MGEGHPATVSQLQSVIERECRIQSDYIKAIAAEAKAMSPFDTDTVEKLNAERAELCEKMAELQDERRELVRQLTGGEDIRLSDAIERCCSLRQKQQLFPLVRRLKVLVHDARSCTKSFNEDTSFSLGIVNSIISIVSSSRHEVSRAYSGRGILKESYHPGGSRLSAVLKQA